MQGRLLDSQTSATLVIKKFVGYGTLTCHCTGPRLSRPLLLSALGTLVATPGSVTPQAASAHCIGREQSIASK